MEYSILTEQELNEIKQFANKWFIPKKRLIHKIPKLGNELLHYQTLLKYELYKNKMINFIEYLIDKKTNNYFIEEFFNNFVEVKNLELDNKLEFSVQKPIKIS